MGCSSSTQTLNQGSNKPPAKTVETNGPKKSASSEISDQIVDDIETIPDQTKLVPLTENEPSTNGTPAAEEQVEAVEAIELDGPEILAPTKEDCNPSGSPVEEDLEHVEESTELITSQDKSVVEGEIEDAVEAKMQEIECERPDTEEDETGHPVDATEPELGTEDVEE